MNAPMVPCEIEAEIALIGCVFLDENIIYQVSDLLAVEDFYDSKNRLIYKTMLQLSKSGKNIDATTVLSTLSSSNLLEQCGGIEYISKIADYGYSTANVESYVELIENAALRRNTIHTLNNLAQSGYDNKPVSYTHLTLPTNSLV